MVRCVAVRAAASSPSCNGIPLRQPDGHFSLCAPLTPFDAAFTRTGHHGHPVVVTFAGGEDQAV